MLREPVVSGQFYPSTQSLIEKQIRSFLPEPAQKKSKALAVVVPHAGYIYSGEVAVNVIANIEIPERVILIGPNHTGIGPKVSIMPDGTWKTPMGNVEIDEHLAGSIIKNSKLFSGDQSAHSFEHSLEVELPILQYFSQNFKIVPIVLSGLKFDEITDIAEAIFKSIVSAGLRERILLLASTDMTHYESEQDAAIKDKLAIEQILKLDAKALLQVVIENDISMCGRDPAAVMIEASLRLGAKEAKLIKYETSAKTSGDRTRVVGYAGLIIK